MNHVKGALSFDDVKKVSGIMYSTFQLRFPNGLFLQFWRSMHDDIVCRFRLTLNMLNLLMSDDELRNYVFYELQLLFTAISTALEKHKLPMPDCRNKHS